MATQTKKRKSAGSAEMLGVVGDGVDRFHSNVHWEVAFDKLKWEKLSELGELHKRKAKRSKSGDDEPYAWVDLGTALPAKEGGSMVQAVCAWMEGSETETLTWSLQIRAKPVTPPPKTILQEHKKLGGKEGLAKILNSFFTDSAAAVGGYHVGFIVREKKGWGCKLIPRNVMSPEPALAIFGRSAKLEEVGYRFTDGILGIDEVSLTYDHSRAYWRVAVEARGPIKIEHDLELPYAKDVCDFVLAHLFERRDTDGGIGKG